jgi:DNA mismatch repair protein MSH5
MIDLNQVSYALRNSTARSLILLDEFGKGTLATGTSTYPPSSIFIISHSDGAGLFCGVLMHLLARGADCPKVIAATHFHDAFQNGLSKAQSDPIAFRHMQIMFTSSMGSMLGDNSEARSNDNLLE